MAMADEQAGEPLASTPRRRTGARRPKGASEPAPTMVPDVIRVTAAPIVVEDGASVAGEHVAVHQGAVGRVDAAQVSVEQGAIGAARAEHLKVERGAIGAALGEQVELSRSYARSIVARQVQLDRAAARIVIAADVRTNQSAVMLLVARKVGGDVRVLLDWRGALAFGAAAGVVLALLGRRRSKKD
jgi:hypothetical protein